MGTTNWYLLDIGCISVTINCHFTIKSPLIFVTVVCKTLFYKMEIGSGDISHSVYTADKWTAWTGLFLISQTMLSPTDYIAWTSICLKETTLVALKLLLKILKESCEIPPHGSHQQLNESSSTCSWRLFQHASPGNGASRGLPVSPSLALRGLLLKVGLAPALTLPSVNHAG